MEQLQLKGILISIWMRKIVEVLHMWLRIMFKVGGIIFDARIQLNEFREYYLDYPANERLLKFPGAILK